MIAEMEDFSFLKNEELSTNCKSKKRKEKYLCCTDSPTVHVFVKLLTLAIYFFGLAVFYFVLSIFFFFTPRVVVELL